MHERNHLKRVLPGFLSVLLLGGCAAPTGERSRIPRLNDLTSAVADLFNPAPRSSTTDTAAALYQDGIDYFNRGRYARSISFFQKLRDEYPFSDEAADAELKIAEAYYLNEEYIQADETYRNYLTYQPTGQHVPYVKYQLGRVNLAQFTGIDRDLEKVREARGFFDSVVKDHPESEHASDARKQLAETRAHLAEREFYVGDYYVNEDRYPAARERFEIVLRDYGDTPAAPRAQAALAAIPAADQGDAQNPVPPTPPVTPAEPAPERGAAEPPFVTKPGYDYEDPYQRTWYSYLNPFSWGGRREPPAERTAASAPPARAGETGTSSEETAPPERKSWFGFLNPSSWFDDGSEKPAPPTPAETVSAKAVVEGVDRTLGTGESSSDDAPTPPVSSLPPEEKDTGPVPDDPAKVIRNIDTRLGTATAPDDVPPVPAADPALFSARKPAPAAEETAAAEETRSDLLDEIDRQLRREGVDSSKLPPPPASP